MQSRLASSRGGRCGIQLITGSLLCAGLVLASALGIPAGPARAATSVDSTAVVLWTAPGDDGMSGRASRYDLRYSSTAIAGTDTAGWWSNAASVSGLPSPSAAGQADSVHVAGLDPTRTWYFCLRTADEVPNWSFFSNVAVRAPYLDHVPPLAITDLRNSATMALPATLQGRTRD